MLDTTTSVLLGRFESVGANCEFGFVQEQGGADIGSLFRWAEIPAIAALTQIINDDFKGVYEFGNLEPFNAGMVRDKANGVAWHSVIRSKLIDPSLPPRPENFAFQDDEPERRRLYGHEIGKVNHLIGKTRASLAAGDRTYVYKPLPKHTVSREEVGALHKALSRNRRSQLLYVSLAPSPDQSGTVEITDRDLYFGYVDRFAPGRNARDVSLTSWTSVCLSAAEYCRRDD